MSFFSKSKAALLLLILIIPLLEAQTDRETILHSYEWVFIRSSLSDKVNVLVDAASDEEADQFYGTFCEFALRFVLENAPVFPVHSDMISLTVIAIRGIRSHVYNPALETLWQVFLRFPDNVIRYEILNTLPLLDYSILLDRFNEYLADQNHRYSSGLSVDIQLFSAIFGFLSRMGDDSSYPALFNAVLLLSGDPQNSAIDALFAIEGDFFSFARDIILQGSAAEKLKVFQLALAQDGITGEQKAQLAEAALEAALTLPDEYRYEVPELTELSFSIIRENEWVRALPQVLGHYHQSLSHFRANLSQTDPLWKQTLLNAVYSLGFLKSAEAAQVLTIQLGLINSRFDETFYIQDTNTESTEQELELIFALINALGQLGYRASSSVLHDTSMLSYPDNITEAARTALASLQW